MGNIEKIIQAIDIQLIQKNKPYMLLAEANRLLTSTRLIADNKALKKIVESGLIPHAYQTQKSPKQWKLLRERLDLCLGYGSSGQGFPG